MAFNSRRTDQDMLYALVAANNQRLVDGISTSFHLDQTARTTRTDYRNPTITRVTVTAADATNLATSLTLVNDIRSVVDTHFADTIAHDSATSAAITIAVGTDLTTAVALANDLKAKFDTHREAANVHFTDDTTNDVTNADATDQTTLNTLVNEIKVDVNAHVASAPVGAFISIIEA
jgi:hypothetical protein